MSADSGWQNVVDERILSIVGAVMGSSAGSIGASAFGRTAALDIVYAILVFGTGGFLGLLTGVRSKGLVRDYFGKPAEERYERVCTIVLAICSIPIFLAGILIIGVGFAAEFPSSGVTGDLIFAILLGLLFLMGGALWLVLALGYNPQTGNQD